MPGPRTIKTVFVVVMENKTWAEVQGSASAPYLNSTLLPAASFATQYSNSGLHPSEPNYLWLEGGTDYGIRDDDDPASHHLANRDHLVSLLTQAGISWKTYQEGIDGTDCPITSRGLYAAKHNPFVFFDDVTDGINPRSTTCIAHVRPLTELDADLASGSVARYNFITPDLCNDMHNSSGCSSADSIANGDRWLADWIPRIRQSSAYLDGGAIFVTWEGGRIFERHPVLTWLDVAHPAGDLRGRPAALRRSAGHRSQRSVPDVPLTSPARGRAGCPAAARWSARCLGTTARCGRSRRSAPAASARGRAGGSRPG